MVENLVIYSRAMEWRHQLNFLTLHYITWHLDTNVAVGLAVPEVAEFAYLKPLLQFSHFLHGRSFN